MPIAKRSIRSGLRTPDEVLERLPFKPTMMAADWPRGVRAEWYSNLPGNELDQPGETHTRVTLQMKHTGRTRFTWGNALSEVEAGGWKQSLLTVTPAGMDSHWAWEGLCESFHVILPDAVIESKVNGAGLKWDAFELRADAGTPNASVALLMRSLEHFLRHPSQACEMMVQYTGEALAAALVHSHGSERPRLPSRTRVKGLSARAIRQVEAVMRGRLSERIELAQLAEAAGYSPDHFTRVFKKAVGMTPWARLRQLRVERAVDLLGRKDRLTHAQIAAAVGFCDAPHLAKMVLRETGREVALHESK